VVRSGHRDEGLGLGVGLGEEAVGRGLQHAQRGEHVRLRRLLVRLAKKPSTALSQEAEAGVKWKVQRRCRSNHARTVQLRFVAGSGPEYVPQDDSNQLRIEVQFEMLP
jgi:hypothetical protein